MYILAKRIQKIYFTIISRLFSTLLKVAGVAVGDGLYIKGIPHVFCRRRGDIKIGKRCKLLSTTMSNAIGVNHQCIIRTLLPGATITIGDNVGATGVTILARKNIVIKDNVLIGANCVISDSDHHPIAPDLRRSGGSTGIESKDVVICDNVWLGLNVIVLKGVVIGENTVVGAGSVVAKSLPANVIAAGNPAKIIRSI